MHYVEPRLVIKCVAELILSEKHACGPDCAASVIAAILVQRAIERAKIGI